jgi:NAD(P)-dependent dehydrogenase (short-subunit alcohol dehydrogenase family)
MTISPNPTGESEDPPTRRRPKSPGRFEGKTVMVTGGAGGLGRATAELFSDEGANVVVCDIRVDEGAEVVRALGGTASFLRLDVAVPGDWDRAVASTSDRFGGIDVLVNNAGLSGAAKAGTGTIDGWHRLMEVNATGVFLGMEAVLSVMTSQGGGSIVNISSVAGLVGMDHVHLGYPASKAAAHLATKTAAVQFGRLGIRVNSVHPGIMPPMIGTEANMDSAAREAFIRAIPLGRIGQVAEIAHAVLFLASDEASYITGTELVVDGGWTAGA